MSDKKGIETLRDDELVQAHGGSVDLCQHTCDPEPVPGDPAFDTTGRTWKRVR